MNSRLLLTVSAVVLFATPVFAQNGSLLTSAACIGPNGQFRLVSANEACRPSENRLAWNQPSGSTGTQGPAGPAGPAGPQGPAGPAGPQGAVGPAGPQGPAGPAGPAGPQGPQGERGADGAAGAQGVQGIQGIQGERGADGAPGAQGIQGERGADGAPGATGPAGPQGERGADGLTGPQGPQGAQGVPGPSALDLVPIIWSGGCSRDGGNPDWNVYCLDSTDFNTASAYLTVNPESISILKPGFYRITHRSIALGAIAGATALYNNGKQFHVAGVAQTGNNPWQWRETNIDVTWPFKAGDLLVIKSWNPGLSAYSGWDNGTFGRVQVQYVGPLQ